MLCLVDEKRALKRAQIRINKITPIFFGDYVKFNEVVGAKKEIIKHRKCLDDTPKEFAGVCIYYTQANKKKNKFISHFELVSEFLQYEEAKEYVFPNIAFMNNLERWLVRVARSAFVEYVRAHDYE